MKKRFIIFALLLSLVLPSQLTSCFMPNHNSNSDGTTPETTFRPEIQQTSFIENPNKYKIVDSFKVDNEKYYYIFDLGIISCMPMNLDNVNNGNNGLYFNGKNTELTFSLTETNREYSSSLIKNTIENSVELTTSTYVEGSLSLPVALGLEASISAGIENSVTTGLTTTFTESYYNSISKETTFEKTVKYTMDKSDETGFYFYIPIASVNIFEVVVYNPSTEKIEYMFPYSQFGESLPGLYFSKTSLLEKNDLVIDFDETKLPSFQEPEKDFKTDIEVSVDPAGASCDTKSLNLKIGTPYGDLPKISKKGYDFKYWSCGGQKVSEDDIVASTKPIVAVWDIKTSASMPIKDTIEVSSTNKINPFAFLVSGYDGESSDKSLDIQEYLDFETLKKEGYMMRIILEYDVKHSKLAIAGLKYNFHFKSDGKDIKTISDKINKSKYVSKKLTSPLIPLDDVTGSLYFTISTENICSVYVKNLNIRIEFVK